MDDRPQRFEQIAMPHLDDVYRMARRLAGSQVEAEDLVQETFLRAYRAFDGFDLREYGARPWLLKILHNVFYTRAGHEARQPTLLDDAGFDNLAGELDQPDCGSLGAGKVDWEQFDEELKDAVDELAAEYREVLLLWSLEELSYKEIAEVCGIPLGTVMSRLYRARQQISNRLAGYARERGLHGMER
ncbi:MAG: sigma-70 family RNA polymerase sigma factor [Planctomycetes bacterium]|nr:sigma-70 family RNA polymerase sigma factor [Planctomycetota bacterium]